MTDTPSKIKALVSAELSAIQDRRVTAHIRGLLVDPTAISRPWDYGEHGQTFDCWAVLNHPKSDTGIPYCEFGFGPRDPWGLVTLSGPPHTSIGMDCGWFESFTSAYFESIAATDLAIWRIFKQDDTLSPGTAIAGESDWQSTWKEIERLRAIDSSSRYDCSHSIQIHSSEPRSQR